MLSCLLYTNMIYDIIWYDIDMILIWYDMIWYDMIYWRCNQNYQISKPAPMFDKTSRAWNGVHLVLSTSWCLCQPLLYISGEIALVIYVYLIWTKDSRNKIFRLSKNVKSFIFKHISHVSHAPVSCTVLGKVIKNNTWSKSLCLYHIGFFSKICLNILIEGPQSPAAEQLIDTKYMVFIQILRV